MSVYGFMYMVIFNVYVQDLYLIDMLFMYMVNMLWNFLMNIFGVIEMLIVCNDSGGYCIFWIIYFDVYSFEMVVYVDLILFDMIYLECYDCILLLDCLICEVDGVVDVICWLVIELDCEVCGF